MIDGMKILFLSTWFPYPPDQGSKIRAYHLLRSLARRHEVALISFEDQPLQPGWIDHVRQLCSRVEIVPRRPFADLESNRWQGVFSRRPRAVVAGYATEMEARVRQVASAWKPEVVVALTFVTAPYALQVPGVPRVVDVDNLTARMLAEAYRQETRWTRRLRRYLAYRKFRRYERSLFGGFDLSLVTSARDADRLRQELPGARTRIAVVPNGVDLEYNRTEGIDRRPSQLVFTGALTYEPNLDAMRYFLAEIFPRVLEQEQAARLIITGRTGGASLPTADGHVTLTGYLEDIRPMIASSTACVVPLRKGAGTRLKILEAMALGTPVVSTSKGAEGLEIDPEVHFLQADDPDLFARQTLRLVHQPDLGEQLAERAYTRVRQQYDWSDIGRRFEAQVESLRKAE
jgi:sugar transferase (PEP-CTERM/EpsH1 system associated)